jgi:hypothetical protein
MASGRRTSDRKGIERQLATAIAKHVAASHEGLSPREVRSLARMFSVAGNAAVRARQGSLREAVASLALFRRLRAAARHRVAKLSDPGRDTTVRSPEFARIHAAVRHHWPKLRRYSNVVGFGAGHRFVDGVRAPERCASILVSRKLSEEELTRAGTDKLPKYLRRAGKNVPIDVIEIGEFKLHGAPADRIARQAEPGVIATLGAFATDNDTQDVLALTALHAAVNDMLLYPQQDGSNDPIGMLDVASGQQALLGNLLRGTRMNGIDAAAIKLDAGQQPSRSVTGVGEIKSWRVLDQDADSGIGVTMCGAVSGVVHGLISNPCVYIPEHNLGPAIQVSIAAVSGDSGAPLVDRDGILLGLLVGGGTNTQFFSPMGNIFHELSCDIY